jgi:putative FmdB family regulatory protein
MPTYEYFCTTCEHSFEAVQSMKDSHFEICPEALCQVTPWGKGCVKRQLGTGAGLIFKGSGFYITDYRSENYKADAKKDVPAGSTPSASSGSGESKPADGAKPKTDAPAAAPKAEPSKPAAPAPKTSSAKE